MVLDRKTNFYLIFSAKLHGQSPKRLFGLHREKVGFTPKPFCLTK